MGRSLSLGVAALGTACGAIFFVIGSRSAPPPPAPTGPPPALEAAVADLGAELREAAAAIDARARTLADLPRLQSAVATDAATVQDLTTEELAFRPRPGETIEIAQVLKSGKVEVLYRTAGAVSPTPAMARAGHVLSVAGGGLYLADVAEVTPRDRADELRGAIALSRAIDVKPLAEKLAALRYAGVLVVGEARLPLGSDEVAAGQESAVLPVPGEPAMGAKLAVRSLAPPVPAPSGGGSGRLMQILALALVAVSWIGAALLGRRRGAAPVEPVKADPSSDRSSDGSDVAPAADPPVAFAATDMRVDGAAQADTPPLARGPRTRIGRYSVLRTLGSGGMADVYLARSTGEAGFEKLVALKVLQRHMAQQPIVIEHFLDEARLASRLAHPNIVQITDLGRADDEYFIAMEYIDGSDLERLLARARGRGAPVPVRVGLTIVRRLCDGLHAAHTAVAADGRPLDLVHRDVKSANVFVSRTGAVKIGDFGIAKANQASRKQLTEVGQVKGTAAYMAPEHRMGLPVDRRADLFAVGAIAYEVLTGTEVNMDLLRLLPLGREGWPHLPPPSKARPELPPELDAILFKALAYEKADRWDSCQAMEEALEQVAEAHGLSGGDKAVAQWVVAELGAEVGGVGAVGGGSVV